MTLQIEDHIQCPTGVTGITGRFTQLDKADD
jgi:hypothetical protein